jgi:hypothetical protein
MQLLLFQKDPFLKRLRKVLWILQMLVTFLQS